MLTTRIGESIDKAPALQKSGLAVARAIHAAVLRGGKPARNLVDLLHGTMIGHPLHPILVSMPIGAWTLAGVCDLLATISDSPDAERAADLLIAVGAVAAVPTAMTGMADYSAIPKPAAGTAYLHGILNTAALALYLLSLNERRAGRRGTGVLLASVAFSLVGMSGALGGDLIYRHQVGVDRNGPSGEQGEWTRVLGDDELPANEPRRVDVDGNPVLLYRDGGSIWAMGALCGHAEGDLAKGSFEGSCVKCPLHHSVFDMRDGSVVHGPATVPQPHYGVRVVAGGIEVRQEPH